MSTFLRGLKYSALLFAMALGVLGAGVMVVLIARQLPTPLAALGILCLAIGFAIAVAE